MKPWQTSFGPDRTRWANASALQASIGPFIEVVGVAKQGKYNDPVDTTTLYYYQPIAQNSSTVCNAATAHRRSAPEALIPVVEQQIHSLAPGASTD